LAHKSNSERPVSALERLTIVLLGLYLATVGVHMIATGHLLYRNYLQGPVLAPVAVAIGVVLICGGVAMRR
jgi:hypothetical protein